MSERPTNTFRWAIFGTGGVARKFVLDLHASGEGRAVTVASRKPENAQAFAMQLGVDTAAFDYGSALTKQVDAVYIATPPALHEDHAALAFAAGCAVLIEKPFAPDAAAAARIAAAAQKAGVFCMEAMWTRFLPLVRSLYNRAADGDLGELRGFEARFMAANIPQSGTSLFDAQSGGALLHRGIYPLSLARHLLGPVAEVQTMGWLGDTGTDEDCTVMLRHRSGALSTLRASLRANGAGDTALYGTSATALLSGPVYRPTTGRILRTHPAVATTGQASPRRFEALRESTRGLALSRGLSTVKAALRRGQTQIKAPVLGNGYRYQAHAVMSALQAGHTEDPIMPLQESVEVMQLADEIRQTWARGESG